MLRYFTHVPVSKCGAMESLERKSHYANIVSAIVGTLCLAATVLFGWLQWKWHRETNGASASGGGYAMNREWVVIVLLGILFVLGLTLFRRGIIYERKLRRQHLPTKYGEYIPPRRTSKQASISVARIAAQDRRYWLPAP